MRIPVRDFNYQLEKVVGYKVLQFIPTMNIKKMLDHKTLCAHTQQLLHKNDELGQKIFSSTNCLNKLCSTLVQLVYTLMALKIIFLYVSCCEKRKPKHTIMDWSQNRIKTLFFINLNRCLSVEMLSNSCRATGLE